MSAGDGERMAGGVSSPEGRAPDERSQPAPSGGLPRPVAAILWLLVVGAFGGVIVRTLGSCAAGATAASAAGEGWRSSLLAVVGVATLACRAWAIRVGRAGGRGWWRAIFDGTWQAGLIACLTGLLAVAITYVGT
jgi:hypothetical protein